jgi:hypothetical protein
MAALTPDAIPDDFDAGWFIELFADGGQAQI